SVWQFLAPLLIGGRTVIVESDVVSDPRELFAIMKREGVTVIELVPAVLQGLLAHVTALSRDERALPYLRCMMATGEAVPVDLVNDWLSAYPGIPAVNAYGPTEAADDVVQKVFDRPLPATVYALPIGRPLANFSCYVLDLQMRPVPIGIPGELCIAGIGVGSGYWKNPEKTASSFLPNPFGRSAGDVLYRTGDLARWLPEGNLEFLGRTDHQVKIRGFRIELGEIEAALRLSAMLRESAVAVHGQRGEKRLVAYVVATEGRTLDLGELRDSLRGSLPAHMLPAAFVVLESMPRTPNGKIDRRALPSPERVDVSSRKVSTPLRTPVEEKLAQIWKEVLRTDDLSGASDFFELGGHSLLATQVLARVRSTFQVEIPLRKVFQCSILAEFAQVIEQELGRSVPIQPSSIQRVARQARRVTQTADGVLKSER
ncbi:MAG TPA: non-ribosomal peptide synthetase, partial [Thermoanaerobaculia bacterium]|nr:non-ribosomal peptide synthetase [Thermoanaerobaculia bacterium]